MPQSYEDYTGLNETMSLTLNIVSINITPSSLSIISKSLHDLYFQGIFKDSSNKQVVMPLLPKFSHLCCLQAGVHAILLSFVGPKLFLNTVFATSF